MGIEKKKYPFTLPELPYSYDALKPIINEETMRFHHDKHFKSYISNLNTTIEEFPELKELTLEEMLKDLDSIPEGARKKIRNNGGGVFNHDLYFETLSSKHNQEIPEIITKFFGGKEEFIKELQGAAVGTFGSGFAWLVQETTGKLKIISLPNQDTPFMYGLTPIVCLDVWEHAYYLDYQNLRGDYVKNWFCITDWENIAKKIK